MPTTEAIDDRIDWKAFQEIAPEFATGMAAITHALKKSSIEPDLRELIKIRASQINGCAFCVQYHLNDARKLNIPAAKLDLLATWRDAGIFSAREWPPSTGPSASPASLNNTSTTKPSTHSKRTSPSARSHCSRSPSVKSMHGIGSQRHCASRRRSHKHRLVPSPWSLFSHHRFERKLKLNGRTQNHRDWRRPCRARRRHQDR